MRVYQWSRLKVRGKGYVSVPWLKVGDEVMVVDSKSLEIFYSPIIRIKKINRRHFFRLGLKHHLFADIIPSQSVLIKKDGVPRIRRIAELRNTHRPAYVFRGKMRLNRRVDRLIKDPSKLRFYSIDVESGGVGFVINKIIVFE